MGADDDVLVHSLVYLDVFAQKLIETGIYLRNLSCTGQEPVSGTYHGQYAEGVLGLNELLLKLDVAQQDPDCIQHIVHVLARVVGGQTVP